MKRITLKIVTLVHILSVCFLRSPGEVDRVSRQAFSSVWRSAMVDHRAVHPARTAVVGFVGFPSLEGKENK